MSSAAKTARKKSEWEQIGIISTDSGMCWLGDPAYVIHADPKPQAIGKDWDDFVSKLADGPTCETQFNHDRGMPGLGVVVPSGAGDGLFPVFVRRNSDGSVAEMRVVFGEESAE